nr:immunoglobulin light chain junction region [Macaca mulatta]MOX73723.1 immunoglobulin light chain junction region [Macaca mulatta]MOX75939.1 immunoglobulin light chain junction region [Macaca mulatta]
DYYCQSADDIYNPFF